MQAEVRAKRRAEADRDEATAKKLAARGRAAAIAGGVIAAGLFLIVILATASSVLAWVFFLVTAAVGAAAGLAIAVKRPSPPGGILLYGGPMILIQLAYFGIVLKTVRSFGDALSLIIVFGVWAAYGVVGAFLANWIEQLRSMEDNPF